MCFQIHGYVLTCLLAFAYAVPSTWHTLSSLIEIPMYLGIGVDHPPHFSWNLTPSLGPHTRLPTITAYVMFVCPATPGGWGFAPNTLTIHDSPRMKEWQACVQRGDRDPLLPGKRAELPRASQFPPQPREPRQHLIGDLGSQSGMELAEEYAFDAAAAAHGASGTRGHISRSPDPREHLSEKARRPQLPGRARLRDHTPVNPSAQQRLRSASQLCGCGGGSSQEVPGG